MKLPGKIWVVDPSPESSRIHRSLICHSKPWTSTYGEPMPYVPASEAEALRERVKQLEIALLKVTSQAERLTRPQTEHWRLAILGSIIDIAREALGGEGDSTER